MKLIRHLLSHILLMAFIVALVFAYFYRMVVFSDQTNNHITRYISNPIQSALAYAGVSSKPVEIDNLEVIKENDAMYMDCEEEKTTNELITDSEESNTESSATKLVVIEETLLTEQDVNEEVISDHEIDNQQESSIETEDTIVDEVELEVKITEATDTSITETQMIESDVVVNDVVVNDVVVNDNNTTMQASEKSYFGLINQARLAYQAGKSDQAISDYLELIKNHPEDPNAYGELGNVYYSKGLWKQASQAYYQAAIQLLKLENREQLHHLHRVIRGLDPDTAKELLNKLEDS